MGSLSTCFPGATLFRPARNQLRKLQRGLVVQRLFRCEGCSPDAVLVGVVCFANLVLGRHYQWLQVFVADSDEMEPS